MASSSIITSQLKKIVQRQSKYAVPFCNANQDPLSIRRSELLQELCKAHKVYQSKNEAFYDSEIDDVPHATSWTSRFMAASHLLESYMLLHHHKEAKRLLYKFRLIDPDRSERITTEKSEIIDKVINQHQTLDELAFLTQFAFVLKQAGYEEIPEQIVKECIEQPHKYNNIEVEAQYKNYLFMRFWVYGRKENPKEAETQSAWKPSFGTNQKKRIFHERVIVASRSKDSTNMILKGFKDIPLDHLEALLPEATIKIPRFRNALFITSLTVTGLFAFFNIGMVFLTEFRMNLLFVLMLFSGIFAFRIYERHNTRKNKHVLALKRMLYYKSTANNAGLVLEVVNKAHERSLKEALIVYGTALRLTESGKTISEEKVVNAATEWLVSINKFNADDINFSSAFALLQRLGLLSLKSHETDPRRSQFHVLPPDDAVQCLLHNVQTIGIQ